MSEHDAKLKTLMLSFAQHNLGCLSDNAGLCFSEDT
jgi:hypothetical protein